MLWIVRKFPVCKLEVGLLNVFGLFFCCGLFGSFQSVSSEVIRNLKPFFLPAVKSQMHRGRPLVETSLQGEDHESATSAAESCKIATADLKRLASSALSGDSFTEFALRASSDARYMVYIMF